MHVVVQDCFEDDERVRFYTAEFQESVCPLRHFRLYNWMVIDNATEMDTKMTYECRASYIATNPVEHELLTSVEYSLVPGGLAKINDYSVPT